MSTARHAAERLAFADPLEAIESYFERGWTDGLPIVPPTPERVAELLAQVAIAPDAVLAEIPARGVAITAEKAAINAVMADGKPNSAALLEHLAVLLRERHGVGEIVRAGKPRSSVVAEPSVLDDLARRVDVFVTAIGD